MDDVDDGFETIESVEEYDTGWFTAGYDLMKQPNGTKKKYYWAALPPAVAVVPITSDGTVILIEQHRPATGKTYTEVPGGIIDPGETPNEAGERELVEETGYTAERTTHLETLDVATGMLRHERSIVVAENVELTDEVSRDKNEFLTVNEVPIENVIGHVRSGHVQDESLEAILLASLYGYLNKSSL